MNKFVSIKTAMPIYKLTMLSCVIVVFISCAKIVPPSGGEIDKTPPELLQVLPQQYQTSFSSGSVIFLFDEFFTLKAPSRNILLSPLIHEELEYEIKGKRLIVHIPENVKDGTTYSILFNNAIADFNEGNILSFLKYTFSTGEIIDSLSLSGQVIKAIDGKPSENMMAFLIPSNADSALYKKQFAYITSIIKGSFKFEHISEGQYHLYALDDKDFNFIYSSIEEHIGFYTEAIEVKPYLLDDSIISYHTTLDTPLFTFNEKDTVLKLIKSAYIRKGLAELHFNQSISNIKVNPIEENIADTIIVTKNETADTMQLWFVNEKSNFLNLEIIIDSIPFDTITLTEARGGRSKLPDIPPLAIKQYNLVNETVLHYFDTLYLKANNPIQIIDAEGLVITTGTDTIIPSLLISQVNPLFIKVVFPFEKKQKYTLLIKDSVLTDCFGQQNKDTLELTFTISDETFYGHLLITFEKAIETCHILQLKNNKDIVKYEYKFTGKQDTYHCASIVPGMYSVYLIYDDNCNGRWDTGLFNKRILPEKTEQIIIKVEITSNWTNEIHWSKK